jgi:pimeloyl-ACP methyl ester carboxylesterase
MSTKPPKNDFKHFILTLFLSVILISGFVEWDLNREEAVGEDSSSDSVLIKGTDQEISYKNQKLLYYIPTGYNKSTSQVFFVIHGYSRTYESYFKNWKSIAEEQNLILISPLFDEDSFSHYQVLNLWGIRADLRLIEIADYFIKGLELNNSKLFMFGFSGGGQFVHRFAMVHPNLVEKAVAGAAGWYSFPDNTIDYPYGIKTSFYHPQSLQFSIDITVTLKLAVIVGAEDTLITSNLAQTPEANAQGKNRVGRAENWFDAMNKTAIAQNLAFNIHFYEVPGVGHSSKGVIDQSSEFLFGNRTFSIIFIKNLLSTGGI